MGGGGVIPPLPPRLETDNPFQSPTNYQRDLDTAGEGEKLPIVPTQIDVMDVLSRTWEIYKGKLGQVMLGVLAMMFLQQGAGFAIRIVSSGVGAVAGSEIAGVAAAGVGQLVGFVFGQWLAMGLILYLLKIGRGQQASFGDVFSGGPFLVSGLLATVLFGLCLVPIVLVAALIGGGAYLALGESPVTAVVVVLVGLLCLVPLVYVGLMFSQYQYLIVDRGATAVESLTLSRTITQGNKLWILLLGILAGLITMMGFFACCVGILFTLPYGMFAYSIGYLVMTGQPTAEQLTSGEPV
jgi:hypothetical protein